MRDIFYAVAFQDDAILTWTYRSTSIKHKNLALFLSTEALPEYAVDYLLLTHLPWKRLVMKPNELQTQLKVPQLAPIHDQPDGL